MEVAVFGAGIAGLTAAHELADLGYRVTVYEKTAAAGGFARSARAPPGAQAVPGVPSEHSWRGYAPFYFNFYDIAGRIPAGDGNAGGTVLGRLSRPLSFRLPRDDGGRAVPGRARMTPADLARVGFVLGKALCAGPSRRAAYDRTSLASQLKGRLSRGGDDLMFGLIGTAYGLDPSGLSVQLMARYAEMMVQRGSPVFGPHTDAGRPHRAYEGWHVMDAPTSEAWFDPWVAHLRARGVAFRFGARLVALAPPAAPGGRPGPRFRARLALAAGGVETAEADAAVLAVDPYSAAEIAVRSGLSAALPRVVAAADPVLSPPHEQISFRLGFAREVRLPLAANGGPLAFTFPDSEYNITLYQQVPGHWRSAPPGGAALHEPIRGIDSGRDGLPRESPVRTLWSGTACVASRPGRLSGLPANRLPPEAFLDEVVAQIGRSAEFARILAAHNGGRALADLGLVHREVWEEWAWDEGRQRLRSSARKWVNNLTTTPRRPAQQTAVPGLAVAGAHTRTSVDVWSMEGAVESGKLAARALAGPGEKERVRVHTHGRPAALAPLRAADEALFRLGLPNVLTVLLLLLVVLVVGAAAHKISRALGRSGVGFAPRDVFRHAE